MQHRRMHDDVVGADPCACLARSITTSMFWSEQDMMVPLGRRALDRDLEDALALRERHREELALLAADEQPVDPEIADPMAQVRRKPASSIARSGVNGISAAAQMPFKCARA